MAVLVCFGLGAAPAAAEDAPAPDIALDQLLKLPDGFAVDGPRIRGASEETWRARFAAADGEIAQARRDIAETQTQLESVVGDSAQWQASAPGLGADPTSSPVSYKLRDEMRRYRDALAAAEKKLLDLKVEANLARVPEDWRH